jgi:deoxycytidine triphosphate deaminase
MILSNLEIQLALDERRLVLDPEPAPRRPGARGSNCPYQTTAVDLRLGDEISYLKDGLPLDINLARGGFANLWQREWRGRAHTRDAVCSCTAPTVHAGFNGTITLELYNMGSVGIALYPGTPICQLIVETVKGVPFRNDSQFQGQRAPAGSV